MHNYKSKHTRVEHDADDRGWIADVHATGTGQTSRRVAVPEAVDSDSRGDWHKLRAATPCQ
jgi:hypothetical protein